MQSLPLILLAATLGWGADAFGTWKMNSARSTFIGDPHPKAVTVRIERHGKNEAFTFDRIRGNGQAITVSVILYFDGKERDFAGDCHGTQSSRRIDGQTVEILFKCSDQFVRFTRRFPSPGGELILDITEQLVDGRHFERHLVLEKQ
jgi:hypothetical protein